MSRRPDPQPVDLNLMLADGCTLVLSDRRRVNLMRLRVELEMMAIGASSFAGIEAPKDNKCFSLLSCLAEYRSYDYGAPDLIKCIAFARSDPLAMLSDPASMRSVACWRRPKIDPPTAIVPIQI